MQSIRLLGKRLNNPKFVRRMMPPLQQTRHDAKDAKIVFQQILNDRDAWLEQRNEIKELFEEMDTNGDGKLDMEDLARALRKGRIPTSHQHMTKIFHEIDSNSNGMIDLDEFTTFVIYRKQKLQQAFQWIMQHRSSDKEQRHGFTAATFRVAASKSGVNLSDDDLHKIMQHLDQDGTKHISYDEFVNCMLFAPDINPRCFLDSWYTEAFTDDAASEYTFPREIRDDRHGEVPFSVVVGKKLGCGGAAGCLSRTLTAPIDRVRILMMTSAERLGVGGALSSATRGGINRLWMGNGVSCLKITPEIGIKLLSFDILKNRIAQDPTNVSVSERFVAGGVAGAIAQATVYPMEVVKTRLAIAPPDQIIGMTGCARQTWSQGGYRAFYAGLGPSIVGIIPYAAIDLALNSILKERAAEYLQSSKQETSVPVLLGCGMVSSGTAAVATFPLNVIRTKAQATGASFNKVLKMLHTEGWRAYYRGLVPCLAKVLPATSISYAAYEYLGGVWDKQSGR